MHSHARRRCSRRRCAAGSSVRLWAFGDLTSICINHIPSALRCTHEPFQCSFNCWLEQKSRTHTQPRGDIARENKRVLPDNRYDFLCAYRRAKQEQSELIHLNRWWRKMMIMIITISMIVFIPLGRPPLQRLIWFCFFFSVRRVCRCLIGSEMHNSTQTPLSQTIGIFCKPLEYWRTLTWSRAATKKPNKPAHRPTEKIK